MGREREEKTEKEDKASDEKEPGKAGYQSLNSPSIMNVSVAWPINGASDLMIQSPLSNTKGYGTGI